MSDYQAHFSRNLKQWREWRGVSMRELGRRTGVAAALVSTIEGNNECNPTLDTMIRLAAGLCVPLETLLKRNSYDEFEARVKRLTNEYAHV